MKALKITAFVLLMLCGLWAIFMAARPSWITPVPGVRLTPTRPILLEKDIKPDSALDLMRRACAARTNTGSYSSKLETAALEEWKEFPWCLEDASNSMALLQQVEASLDLARRAAVAPDPQVVTVTHFSQLLPATAATRATARAFKISAGVKAVKGDYGEASSELQSIIGFSDILSRGGVLIQRLVAMACNGLACETMRDMALNCPIPDSILRDQAQFLQKNEQSKEPWVECVRHEAKASRSAVEEVCRNPAALDICSKSYSGLFQIGSRLLGSSPAVVQTDVDACWTHLVSMAERPYDRKAYDEFESKWQISKWKMFLSRDPVGRISAALLMPSVAMARVHDLKNIATLRATRIVLGVIMFKRAENRLPRTLDELVPKYLDKVPDDPFDGKPMKYRLDPDGRWVVYSIGGDQVDDGGIETDPGGRPDLIFGPTELP